MYNYELYKKLTKEDKAYLEDYIIYRDINDCINEKGIKLEDDEIIDLKEIILNFYNEDSVDNFPLTHTTQFITSNYINKNITMEELRDNSYYSIYKAIEEDNIEYMKTYTDYFAKQKRKLDNLVKYKNVYSVNVLNSWGDIKEYYVDFIITNNLNGRTARCCDWFDDDYNNYNNSEVINRILNISEKWFELPKTSQINDITYKLFKEICNSDNNTIHIDKKDYIDFYNLTDENINLLKTDIIRFNLKDYIDFTSDKIIIYGGFQTAFNDDRKVERRNEKIMRDEKIVNMIKKRYPVGTRIKLNYMEDKYSVPSGTCGTVDYVDDEGQIGMKWDNGSTLSLVYGVDSFDVIKAKSKDMER